MTTTAIGHPWGRFALRLLLVSGVVGVLVTFAAGRTAGGACGALEAGQARVAADPICDQLVRTLSTRMGLASAIATVVIVLTMAGIARLNASQAGGTWRSPRR